MSRLRVLHITRNYPNSVFPRLGLWTERLLRSTLVECEAEVIAPVPYWPPVPGPDAFTRYRRVEREYPAYEAAAPWTASHPPPMPTGA